MNQREQTRSHSSSDEDLRAIDAPMVGTFDNPEALDTLNQFTLDLAGEVSDYLDAGHEADPDALGEAEVMPRIEILVVVCRELPAQPPIIEDVQSWRGQYLRRWDHCGHLVAASDEQAEQRRKRIEQTFEQLEELSRRYWSQRSPALLS